MSIFFVNTQDAQISNAFLATLGVAPGSTYLAQVKTFGLVPSVQAMINATGSSTAAALSTKVATNLGLTGAALTGGTAYLSSVTFAGSSSAWAANLMETLNLFSNLQSDATYGSAATAYLARVNSAVSYSSVATNNSTDLSTLAAAVGSAGSTGAGSTFTLTASADNFNTTSSIAGSRTTEGNDLFRATATDHLTSADFIDGGAGRDTLDVVQTAAVAGVVIKPLLRSVEVINLTGTGVGTNSASSITLDLADSTGVEQVFTKDSVGGNTAAIAFTVNFTNLVSGVEVGIIGGAKGSSDGLAPSLTVGVKNAATNIADTLKISLSNALANVVTAAEIETITLSNSNTTATAASTVAALTADKVKVLNIDGSGTLTVSALTGTGATLTNLNIAGSGKNSITTVATDQTALKTIDASTATGNNTVKISGTVIANTKVTMGGGDDKVVFDSSAEVATAIGTEGLVAGGLGKDTLSFSEAALDSTDATAISKATGFEVIETTYAGATGTASVSLDASAFTGINEFIFAGATVGKSGVATASEAANKPGSEANAVTGIENNDIFIFTANQTGAVAISLNNAGSQGATAKAALTTAPKLDTGTNVLNITLRASTTVDSAAIILTGGLGAAKGAGTVNTGPSAVGVEASSFETVNLISTGKSAATFTGNNQIKGGASGTNITAAEAITLNTNGKLVITGNKHLDLMTGVGGTNATVDASAFTGFLQVKTMAGNNTLIGGSGNDLLEGGAGADTYTGGAGKDTFRIGTGEAGLSGAETITDFQLNLDILDINGTTAFSILADRATGLDVVAAITGGAGGDILTATVSKGIITLAGNAVAKIDTAAELKAIFELLDTNSQIDVGAIVMGGNTFVIIDDVEATGIVQDIIQLTGITDALAISATAASGVIVVS